MTSALYRLTVLCAVIGAALCNDLDESLLGQDIGVELQEGVGVVETCPTGEFMSASGCIQTDDGYYPTMQKSLPSFTSYGGVSTMYDMASIADFSKILVSFSSRKLVLSEDSGARRWRYLEPPLFPSA